MGALFESGGIALKARMITGYEPFFESGAPAHPCGSGMMLRQIVAGVASADEPRMPGDLDAAAIDQDLGQVLVDGDRLPDVLLRGRVTIGVDTDVAVEINHALQHLIDRWQDRGQRLKIRLLDEIGRLR